jgi:hypothetical protein
MANRRDFLKLVSAALGGTVLSACGTTPTDGAVPPRADAPPLPNGFRFFALSNSAAPLPGGVSSEVFRMDAMIHDGQEIVYSAVDTGGGVGLYAVKFDVTNGEPRASSARRVIHTSQHLDGRPVLGLSAYDMNASGQIALVVKTEGEYLVNTVDNDGKPDGGQKPMTVQHVYLERGRGWERLLDEHARSLEGHELVGHYHDVDIHDDGNVIFVADYVHNDADRAAETRNGVFLTPKGASADTRLVVSAGQRLTQSLSSSVVSRFGLVDLHDRGQFVVQGAIAPLRASDQADRAPPESVLLRGNLGQVTTMSANANRLNALSVASASSGSGLRSQRSRAEGLSLMGARSGPRGSMAQVLHTTPSTQDFVLNDVRVASTGDLSPMGERILSFVSPVMASSGEVYFCVYTEAGFELCAHNGVETRTMLRTGDKLANDPRPIASIHLGNLTNQVDRSGRLAFIVTHQDAANTTSVVLGLPI